MVKFQRNWNVFGIGEPLLFPVKRMGQPKIHLARFLQEFLELTEGECYFYEFNGEVKMRWDKNGMNETWTFSQNRGSSNPREARNVNPTHRDFLTINDKDLMESLRDFSSSYQKRQIKLATIIGIGGEGTVLEEVTERLMLTPTP